MRRIAGLVAAATIAGGCIGFVDKGSSLVAQNDSDQELIARLTVTVIRSGTTTEVRAVTIPARTRLVFAVQPFAGDHVQVIEFLDSACRSLGRFYAYDGGAFAISAALEVAQRHEFPDGEATAATTAACPAPPVSSATPSAAPS